MIDDGWIIRISPLSAAGDPLLIFRHLSFAADRRVGLGLAIGPFPGGGELEYPEAADGYGTVAAFQRQVIV